MSDFRYDTYCGLYCGACDIMQAYRKSIETGIRPGLSDLPDEIRNLPFNVKDAEIKCYGCKTDIVFAGCSKCFIRKCAKSTADIETCLDCNRYPCWRHKLTAFAKKLLNLEQKLPHLKTAKPNLETIKNKGLQYWLKEQKTKWQCTDCEKPLSWYSPSCKACNHVQEKH